MLTTPKKTIDWYVICKQENEYWNYTIWKEYIIENWMITDDSWNWTNFSNVKKWFKIKRK